MAAVGSTAATMWPSSGKDTGAVPRRPNFVIVLADDLGYGELGSYGQQSIRTPRLDQLAAEGLRFTDFYAGAPVCAPSRCSLLTGLHTGHSTVRTNPQGGDAPLAPGGTTIGTTLRTAGYRTGLFGKWGFGPPAPGQPGHPNAQGFEEFFGYLTHGEAHKYYPAQLWQNQQAVAIPDHGYGPDLIVDRALGFIERHRASPFLLMLTLPLPHAPSVVPDPVPYENAVWPAPDKGHAAQVTRLDSYVGQVIDRIRALGLADTTIVLVTSDNGPHEEGGVDPGLFNASGGLRGLKRNLYEGGIRVPLIAWSPKLFSGTIGRQSHRVSAVWDLLPTLNDFAGVRAPARTDGISLRKALTGRGGPDDHRYLYWSRSRNGRPTATQAAQDRGRQRRAAAAVRFGQWKLLGFGPRETYSDPDHRWSLELYDLWTDPRETTDLAKAHPALVAQGMTYLREAWTPPGP